MLLKVFVNFFFNNIFTSILFINFLFQFFFIKIDVKNIIGEN